MFSRRLSSKSGRKGVRSFILDYPWNERPRRRRAANSSRRMRGRCGVDFVRGEAIIIVMRTLPLLILLICSGNATELLRDNHTDTTYVFETDAKDVVTRINRKDAILEADEWATGFYGDDLLRFVECQFKTKPIGHWLVTFQKADTGQQYYAVILPDGRFVIPSVERGF
jgi:hypothetical protein